MREDFIVWFNTSDSIIEIENGIFTTQCSQYRNRLKGVGCLYRYFIKEYM